MTQPVIKVQGLGKKYKLGLTHAGSVRELANRAILSFTGKSKPPTAKTASESRPQPTDHIWALRDVNFEVFPGEVLGIIGRNGAGKSTLLKILSRITKPTRGRVEMRGRVASLLEVGTGFHPELTGRENVYMNGTVLGMTRSEIDSQFDSIIDFSGVEAFIDTPVKRYSSGMTVRLGFAVAAHMSPEILIIDEVLAVGDAEFQKRCIGKMDDVAKSGRTVLFVSHNMAAVKALCRRTLILENGSIFGDGATSHIVDAYLSKTLKKNSTPVIGFQYFSDPLQNKDAFQVTGIQLFNNNGKALDLINTWSAVCIRVHFYAPQEIKNGAVEILIKTRDGTELIRCSTRPESNVPYRIVMGASYVDCLFSQWPLTEGTYVLEAGLARPRVEYLCWHHDICELAVVSSDIFQSGKPPNSGRYVVATEHSWLV